MEKCGKIEKLPFDSIFWAPRFACNYGIPVKRLSTRLRKDLAERVAQRRIPIKRLAYDASCTERTVRNFLNGRQVRDETVRGICAAASIDVEVSDRSIVTESSDRRHGSYSKELVQGYIGYFYAYRCSFSLPKVFIRSLYAFEWSQTRSCLRFKECQSYLSSHLQRRVSYDQEGDVFISSSIGLVHLLTEISGAVRLITLTRLHPGENVMRGSVLTQAEWPHHYQPAVSPIYFRKILEGSDVAVLGRIVGTIEVNDPDYPEVKRNLEYTERNVANFVSSV